MSTRHCPTCRAEVEDTGGFCLLGHSLSVDPVGGGDLAELRAEVDRAFAEARVEVREALVGSVPGGRAGSSPDLVGEGWGAAAAAPPAPAPIASSASVTGAASASGVRQPVVPVEPAVFGADTFSGTWLDDDTTSAPSPAFAPAAPDLYTPPETSPAPAVASVATPAIAPAATPTAVPPASAAPVRPAPVHAAPPPPPPPPAPATTVVRAQQAWKTFDQPSEATDPIEAFAPPPRMDWGPARRVFDRLGRR